MKLVEADVEFAHGVGCDVQRERRHVGIEKTVEAAADAIIVEGRQLTVRQAEQFGFVPQRPQSEIEFKSGSREISMLRSSTSSAVAVGTRVRPSSAGR